VSDHDGVDDAHGHPADLGEDEWEGEREHGTDLVADRHRFWVLPPHGLFRVKSCIETR
jgi:hypothetical protein